MKGYRTYKRGINTTPREEQECYVLVEYLELKNIKYSHIHHEMFTRSKTQKWKQKMLGVKPGLPDYIICLKDKLLFIEMKRLKGGKLSESQKGWIDELNKIQNVEAYVCYGFDEAKKVIDEAIKIEK